MICRNSFLFIHTYYRYACIYVWKATIIITWYKKIFRYFYFFECITIRRDGSFPILIFYDNTYTFFWKKREKFMSSTIYKTFCNLHIHTYMWRICLKMYITPLSESSVVVLIYFINPIGFCVYIQCQKLFT